jgi:ribosomal-protein-alanine N-acetyltransferase
MPVRLIRPSKKHAAGFLRACARSRKLHRNLVTPVKTEEAFCKFVNHCRSPRCSNFFVVLEESKGLVGAINIENISRGFFQSATLGYYAFVPHAGKGLMREGLVQVITHAFRDLRLHRLEANIQPTNVRSINLVKSLGFRLEGYSPKFLKISGRWRDHERWAIHAAGWRPSAALR